MTVLGVIWGIFAIGGLLFLLGEAMKCALHIDKWSDLRRRKEEPTAGKSTFMFQGTIHFNQGETKH